jgi:phosphatidylglycerol:prolipoprotein diacylglycerol transferase
VVTTFGVINVDIDPVLAHLGPIAIHWYGLMYVVAMLAGLWVVTPYAEARGVPRTVLYDGFWPVLIAALIGGRLYYVVQSNFGWYVLHPTKIIATWEGGMAFYGAVFAGIAAVYLVCRMKSVSFLVILDIAALFTVAQAIGRIGNVINGDVIGYPSSLPWAFRYTNVNNSFVPSHQIAYQPAAAYELLFSLALFAFLWTFRWRFRVPGTLFALFLVLYSAGQFCLFFARANSVVLLGLRQAQLTALVVMAVTIPAWYVWQRSYRERTVTAQKSTANEAKFARS